MAISNIEGFTYMEYSDDEFSQFNVENSSFFNDTHKFSSKI